MDHEPLTVSVPLSPKAARSRIHEALAAQGLVTAQLHRTDECHLSGSDVLITHCPRLTRRAVAAHGHVRAAAPTIVLITPNGMGTVIEVNDPITVLDLADDPILLAVLVDTRCRIQRALAAVHWPSAVAAAPGREQSPTPTQAHCTRQRSKERLAMIELTEAAHDKLTEILNTQTTPDNAIRISDVRGPHGCIHGWALSIDHTPHPDDVVETVGNVPIAVGADLIERLHGATINYHETGDRTLGFTIDTPERPGHSPDHQCHH